MDRGSNIPSIERGWEHAKVLWRIVILAAFVPFLLAMPSVTIVGTATRTAVADLPGAATQLPPGEIELIVIEALSHLAGTLSWFVLAGCLSFWVWTTLWHAGVVTWAMWSTNVPVKAASVLGLGALRFWRFFRLSLTGGACGLCTVSMMWLVILLVVFSALGSGSERLIHAAFGCGLIGTLAVCLLFWMATLRAAWLLGEVTARSAFLTWFKGLWHTLRHPLESIVPVLVWGLPGLLLGILPLAIGISVPIFAGGFAGFLLGIFGGLLQAFCWVALFTSYAPSSIVAAAAEKGSEKKEAAE